MSKIGSIAIKLTTGDNFKSLLSNLMASSLGVVVFLLIARKSDVHDFGSFTLFMSICGIFDLIRTGLLRQALVREIRIAEDKDRHTNIYQTGLFINWLVIIPFIMILPIGWSATGSNGLLLFIKWYPLLIVSQGMHQFGSWIAQAKGDFSMMNRFRLVTNLLFIAFILLLDFLNHSLTIDTLLWMLTISNTVASLLSIAAIAELRSVPRYSTAISSRLVRFGYRNMMTLLGSNLLKSSDVMILGFYWGNIAVAQYAIPFKLLEIVEIPFRSFLATAYPKMTEAHARGMKEKFMKILTSTLVRGYLISVPVAIACFYYPEFVINKISGTASDSDAAFILKIVAFAMILIPLDKTLGLALDAQNKPGINAIKVWIMVIINILGDFSIALVGGHFAWIVFITVANQLAGIGFSLRQVLQSGFLPDCKLFLASIWKTLKNRTIPTKYRKLPVPDAETSQLG
ncbi:MAG: oligosaccharide flippase family protein [Cyclobacteriaceae bacterium]|nr:oligosaccharide flippase family protein [Cyclobacteriaceae bacterium HetDA_MAG_MS6]